MKRFCSARELLLSALMLLATLVFLFTADKARSSGEPTTVPSAPAATDAPAPSAAPSSAPASAFVPSPDSLFDTPADVLEKEREAKAAYASAEPVGTVQEIFYRDQGATDAVGAVRVKNATYEQDPDFAALIEEGPALEVENKSAPTVLIFHTHTSEAYLGAATGYFYGNEASRSLSPDESVVRVGSELAAVLEQNGIGVIHDTAVYDDVYTGAYARSREAVEAYLREYPTILITLDVHRDATYNNSSSAIKPTAVIDGAKAAQVMIITGAEEGDVTSFPNWQENLRFALALQNAAEARYPGLMRPVFFCRRRYNMDLTPNSLLLEFGSDTNTLAEAVLAGRMIGQALSDVISSAET
ncbi:MAG: stage II sporulation protein P [Clostridia bacterium]|nr:stage II sporulation protein P [Clostridia bacterium]